MFYCKFCWVKFSSNHEAQVHVTSNSHVAVKKFEANDLHVVSKYFCQLCSIFTNSQRILDVHKQSIKHINRVALKEMALNNPNWVPITDKFEDIQELKRSITSPNIVNSSVASNWCDLCFLFYTSEIERHKHLTGKEHKKRVDNRLKIEQALDKGLLDYCVICCLVTTSREVLKFHLNHANHYEQVKRYETYKACNKDSTDWVTMIENKDEIQLKRSRLLGMNDQLDNFLDQKLADANSKLGNLEAPKTKNSGNLNEELDKFMDQKLAYDNSSSTNSLQSFDRSDQSDQSDKGASCEDLRRSNYLFEKMGVEFSKYESTNVTKYPTIYSLQAEQDLKALENAFAACFDALR